jgi:uncharacterized repeat protein (TIGR03803 family)
VTPNGAPLAASDGNLYGTAESGGDMITCRDRGGCGTIWRLTPGGRLEAVHRFHGSDGMAPDDRLLEARDGTLYGTTIYGGDAPDCHVELGCGVLFRLPVGGRLHVLHRFDLPDGIRPYSGLVAAPGGELFGVGTEGGPAGMGTIFRIDQSTR